jgi:hypothetical protein
MKLCQSSVSRISIFWLICLDSNDTAKLLEVIEREFSLEILLKNQERKTIEAEKAKVEVSLKQLEQCLAGGGISSYSHVSL